MAHKLQHIRSILSQQFAPYVIEIFCNYCDEEQYEETNIEEDIEEPKDSIIYEHMQSTLQWTDFQTNRFMQALQTAIHSQTLQTIESDSDIDDIYASSSDYPSTSSKASQKTSKELQSILQMLSSFYSAHVIDIFSSVCQEQEYLDKLTILEDIEEDDSSFIAEHMQSKCHWSKPQSQSFIHRLHDILNGKTPQPMLHMQPSPNMLYKSAIHREFGVHPLLEALFKTLLTPTHSINGANTHHNVMDNLYKTNNHLVRMKPYVSPSHNAPCNEHKPDINPIKNYTNVDIETRARISLRQTMKKQFENGTFYNQIKAPFADRNATPLLDDARDFEDDDDWNTVNDVTDTRVSLHHNDLSYDNYKNVDRMVGLRNIGATCYMNAVLQALNCSDMYRDFLLNKVAQLKYDLKYAKKYRMPKQPLHELQNRYSRQQRATIEFKNVLRGLHDKQSQVIHTRDLVRALPKRWSPEKQQDSNEFAKFVLNCIWETIDQSSIMKDIYEKTQFGHTEIYQLKQLRLDPYSHGMLNYTTKCTQCHCKSAKFEAFFDLALALSNHKRDGDDDKECKLSTKELIEDHMKEEQLTKDNAYFCNKCMRNVKAVRYISIVRPPKLLLICFKRYLLNTRTKMREKIMTNVDCPILLQIERDIYDTQNHEKVPYILYAVVTHHGLTAQFGHYFTIGRHSDDALNCYKNNTLEGGSWYRFDDERVTKSSYEQLRTLSVYDTPYMLFYLRVEDE